MSSTAAPTSTPTTTPAPTTPPPITSVPGAGGGGSVPSGAPGPDASGRPDYIPEKYWDATAKAPRVEDLGRAYGELSSKLGKGKDAFDAERLARRPEAPDKYELAIDGYSPEFLQSHPLTPVIREIAYESGLDQQQFKGLAAKVVGALAAAAPKPEDELAKLGENASVRVQAAERFVTTTFNDPAEREALALVATTAAGVKVIEKMIAMVQGTGGNVPPADNPTQPTRKTKAEIDKMMQDKRYYDPRHRDETFVKEVTDWFKGA